VKPEIHKQPAAEIVGTERNEVLCAHKTVRACVCLVIYTLATTYSSLPQHTHNVPITNH